MAKLLPLSRSYYAWITKIRLTESEEFAKKLPNSYPTQLLSLRRSTKKLCEDLCGTEYFDRARYWRQLFEKFSDEPQNRIDEGKKINFLLTILGKVFVKNRPSTDSLPPDDRILQKLKEFHRELIKIRKEKNPTWTYRKIKQTFTDDEEEALKNAIGGIPAAPGEEDEIRKKLRYKMACWTVAFASVFSAPYVARSLAILPAFVWEYFLAFVYYITEKAFGKKEAEEIADAV